MRTRILRISGVATFVAVLVVGMTLLTAQAPGGTTAPGQNPFNTDAAIKTAAEAARAAAALKNWTAPKTAVGRS